MREHTGLVVSLFCTIGGLSVNLLAAPTLAGPASPDVATRPTCKDQTGTITLSNCTSRAFYSDTIADMNSTFTSPGTFNGTDPGAANTFKKAFDNWNPGGWTLVNGGALDVKFTITTFKANVTGEKLGGMDIVVNVTKNAGYAGPTDNQLAWTQGLYITYEPRTNTTNTANPYNTLDAFSFNFNAPPACLAIPNGPLPNPNDTPSNIPASGAGKYCDPIYPFQFNDVHFEDGPLGYYSVPDSFRGIALLSTVTFKTNAAGAITDRILTVYNGVNYGFDLSAVPEPSFYLVLGIGLVGLWVFQRRRRIIV